MNDNTPRSERTASKFEKTLFARLDFLKRESRITLGDVTSKALENYGLTERHAVELVQLWKRNHNAAGEYDMVRLS